MSPITSQHKSLVIRSGNGTLSFLVPDSDGSMSFYPYSVKTTMSLAANLREAFKEQPYLHSQFKKATLMVTSPVLLMPMEEYEQTDDFDAEAMYSSVMTGHKGEEKIKKAVQEFNTMAVYPVNRDLKMVATDNCEDVDIVNIMLPVWKHLYKRYYQNGEHRKLFAYFHDKNMDICSFEQRRLHFANTFNAQHAHDALYYLLFVWKQLGMRQKEDDLFVIGEMPHADWLKNRLNSYIRKVHIINPEVALNRSPLSQIEDMPFDLMI